MDLSQIPATPRVGLLGRVTALSSHGIHPVPTQIALNITKALASNLAARDVPANRTVCRRQPPHPHSKVRTWAGGSTETPNALGAQRQSHNSAEAQLLNLKDPAQLNGTSHEWHMRQHAAPREDQATLTIPHVLHQSWKGCTVPPRQRIWQEHCERVLPADWEMWLWTDEANRQLIARHFPSFLTLYDAYDLHIKRVDAVRFFYMWLYGGVCAHILPATCCLCCCCCCASAGPFEPRPLSHCAEPAPD